MTYLLVGKNRRLRQTRWLTEQHYAAARRGELVLVDMARGRRYVRGEWRPIPARRGEPLVMLLPREDDEAQDEFI